MGQHHPQLGAAALLVRLLLQLVHLLQHPLRLRDEPLALLGGDHARGGALENAHPVFLFQILQRLADIGLRRVQLLCRRRHRPPFHDGYQIPQFRNIHEPLRVVCSRNYIVTISPRRCQAGEFFALSRRAAGRFDDLECAPLRSAHNQRNLIFIFVFQKRLRAFLERFFTRGVVKMNGSCLPLRPLP